jgi:hypothetical protein
MAAETPYAGGVQVPLANLTPLISECLRRKDNGRELPDRSRGPVVVIENLTRLERRLQSQTGMKNG